MKMSFEENPDSHYNRYLAFFRQPHIRPEAMRQEVANQFLNPDLMLLDADRLLEDETNGRVRKHFETTADKLTRNGMSGAIVRPHVSLTSLCRSYPDSERFNGSKRVPHVVSLSDPHIGHNPNKLFGRLGNNHTPFLYESNPAGGAVTSEFFQQLLEDRRVAKYGRWRDMPGHELPINPSKKFTDAINEAHQFEIMRRVEDWEQRVADFFTSSARQTGKTWSSTLFREAITTGSYLAGTWLKPLYRAMYKRGPTIQ